MLSPTVTPRNAAMRCPACGRDQPDGHRFCEDCGTRLDGPDPDARTEQAVSAVLAGVSDRGKRPRTNQDAFALASDPAGDVLVVCDGVSSSQSPEVAAQSGAAAACGFLVGSLREGAADETAAVRTGVWAAQDAVAGLPRSAEDGRDPPEATIVAAVRRGRRVAVGWLGDSRAYHVTPDAARQLTADHSWLREEVEAGRITPEEGRRSPLAHAITRTLGSPEGPDEPEVRAFDLPPGPGLLLLCTNGLWAAFPDPAELTREAWRLAADGGGAGAGGRAGTIAGMLGRDRLDGPTDVGWAKARRRPTTNSHTPAEQTREVPTPGWWACAKP